MKYLFIILCLLLSSDIYAQKAPVTAKGLAPGVRQNTAGVYNSPDEKAYFPFGQDSLYRFIKRNIHFNDAGDKIAGKATVVFIVEKNGSIGKAEILSASGNKNFDKEAVAVVKMMRGWKPAKNKGKAVRSSAMLSVVYQVK